MALPTLSVPRLVAAALVVRLLVALPETLSVWPVAVSVVAPVVLSTAVVPRVLVNCVAAPVRVAVPVTALFCVSVIGWPAALTVRAPASVKMPVWLTAPVEVTFIEPAVVAPKLVVLPAPPEVVVVSKPVVLPEVTRLPPAISVLAPPSVSATVMPLVSVSWMLVPVAVTVPPKSLPAFVNVMALAPALALIELAPVTVRLFPTPCVTFPAVVSVRAPVTLRPVLVVMAVPSFEVMEPMLMPVASR